MTSRRALLSAVTWALLALAVAGCSRGPKPKAAVADPAPAPRPQPPTVAQAAPVAEDSLAHKRPVTKPKSNGSGAAKPQPPEPGPSAVSGGSSSAPAAAARDTIALVEPALTPEERAKLEEKTRTTIEAAKSKLENIDAARLDAERLRKYRLASDYLSEAVRARDVRDLQRASSLALKAKLLAEEL